MVMGASNAADILRADPASIADSYGNAKEK
jgi:hypothetical protein